VDGISGKLIGRFPNLKPIEPIKFGNLYQCTKCGHFWFLPEHKAFLHRIRDEILPLAQAWKEGEFFVGNDILGVLKEIGGVENYYKDQIFVPCSVIEKSGIRAEKAIILISKNPPYNWPKKELIHWADEITSVQISPFALPHNVRKASMEKREESMGFSPVGIIDDNEEEYTLGCQSHFFDFKGVKGKDVRLSGREKKWKKVVFPGTADAYYFVDWFDGCEKLLSAEWRNNDVR